MAYLLTQIFWCLLATAILFFGLGWLVRTWFKGRAANDNLITETERSSWQTSLDIVKSRLEAETSRKHDTEKALANLVDQHTAKVQTLTVQLTDKSAALEQSDARVKQLQTRIVEVGVHEDLSQELARQKAHRGDLEKQLATAVSAGVEVIALRARLAAMEKAPSTEPDDLKKIHGIGPVLEKRLQGLGVTSFRQIARWSEEDIQRFEGQLKEFRNRIQRDKWVESAREEHFKKYGEEIERQNAQAASASSF